MTSFVRWLFGPVLVLAACAQAQSPLERFQEHCIRGEIEKARAALRGVEKLDDATRAMLQAALQPVAERAMAMQQVARIYPKHAVADTAIVAGCAALLSSQGRRVISGVDRPKAGRKLPKGFDLVALIKGFRALIVQRRARKGDADQLAEADWMLRTLSVNEVVSTTRRVRAGGRLPVPSPLGEDMVLRFYPFDRDRPLLDVFRDRTIAAIEGGTLKKGVYKQTVAVPPPGVYAVELTAKDTGWSRLERIIVSDLSLVTQTWPGRVVVMASRRDGEVAKAAGATELTLTIRPGFGKTTHLTKKTDASGFAAFDLPKNIRSMRLDAKFGPHTARMSVAKAGRSAIRADGFKSHLITDRPIYRPGETVHGRVLVRHQVPIATRTPKSKRFETRVYRDHPVEIRIWPRSKQEVILRGRTDDHGVFVFQTKLRASAPLGNARVHVLLPDEDLSNGKTVTMHQNRIFTVQEFRRPVILARTQSPAKVGRDKPFAATFEARYASGAPAAGLRVDVTATCGGLSHRTTVALDDAGRAEVPIHAHELPLPAHGVTITVKGEFHSPDGQRIDERSYTEVTGEERPRGKNAKRFAIERIDETTPAGQPLRVRVTGKPHERVLLTTVRDVPLGSRVVDLDATGQAEVAIATQHDDFPGLQLNASLWSRRPAPPVLTSHWEFGEEEVEEWSGWDDWYYGGNIHRQTFTLTDPRPAIDIAFEHEKQYRPGQRAEIEVRATRAGKPVAGTIAVTIVDETIYSLEKDRNAAPARMLAPKFTQLLTPRTDGTTKPASPWHILGRLLRLGMMEAPEEEEEVAESEEWNEAIGLGGGAGGKFGGRAGGRRSLSSIKVRKRFRPTAHFVGNLVTDAQGRAKFAFAFPDDLTRWRITAFVVEDTFRGRKSVSHTETRLPVSVTPVLPRVMRSADALEVHVAAAQDADGDNEGTITLQSGDTETVAVRAPTEAKFTARGRVPHRATFQLRAGAAKTARLTARALLGDEGDAAELPLPVLPDLVVRPVVASALISGEGALALPRDHGVPTTQQLRLLGNRDALLREAADYLEGYPYGCVEQVLSRLTPIFVAARATRLRNGGDGPVLTEAQALRLEAGMVALRGHSLGSSTGFRWWRGNRVDKRMTALALHSLMIARDAGIDPERYGVRIRGESNMFRRQSDRIWQRKGKLVPFVWNKVVPPNSHDAELVVALCRYCPKVINHKRATRMLLDADQELTPGLVARIGLALLAAGDKPGAEKALDRILAGKQLAKVRGGRGTWFPLDRIAARTAHTLELALRLDPKHKERNKIVGRLLGLSRDGKFGSTYSTASALHALALDTELTGQRPSTKPVTVRVTQGGRERIYTLDKNNGFAADCKLGADPRVAIRVDEKREVHALLRGGVAHPGSTHKGWTAPIRVTRALHTVTFDSTGKETRTRIAENAVPHGRVVELTIDVTCAEDVSYLVVECPLPAGFEVMGRPYGVEVRDDRVVKLVRSLRTGNKVEVRVKMVPAHKGTAAWPPAVVQAMYQPDMTGATRGNRVTVVTPKATVVAKAGGTQILTKAHLQPQLDQALAKVQGTLVARTARYALRDIDRVFYDAGEQLLLPHMDALVKRWRKSPDTLQALYDAVDHLPAARTARKNALAGAHSTLGYLMLACGGKQDGDGDRWLPALTALLEQADFRTLLLARFDRIVGSPWRQAAQRLSSRDMLLHSDGPEVAAELAAWSPVLRGAVGMILSQPDFGSSRSKLPLSWLAEFEIEFGAAPSENWKFVQRELDTTRWLLADRLVAHGNLNRIGWLATLNATKDRERLRNLFVALFAKIDANTSHKSVAYLMHYTPLDLRPALADQFIAQLDHPDGEVRWVALRTLPVEQRLRLPEAVLRRAFEESNGSLHMLKAFGDRGVQMVRRWVLDGVEWLESDTTAAFLGREGMKGLPLEALARLADPESTHLVTLALAKAKFEIADLQMAMHENAYGPWRICLVEELGRRGAKKLLLKKDDPLKPTYERLLGAFRGDVAASLEVARRLREDDGFRRARGNERRKAMPAYLRRAHVRSIVRRINAEEFVAWWLWLGTESWQRALHRFGLEDWHYLLTRGKGHRAWLPRHVPKKLERALLPELVELLRLKSARATAADRILQTKGGEAMLREKLTTREWPADVRRAVAGRVFAYSGRAVRWLTEPGEIATHAPSSGASVATRVRRDGLGVDWSKAEAELLRTLLRRRGLAPAGVPR